MNNNIDELLQKYFEAETSLQEEAILRAYFVGGDISANHKEYEPLFSFFIDRRSKQCDMDLAKILEDIDVDDTDIDALLEKYFEAESSLEEERWLQTYFSKGNVADRHQAYTHLFGYFTEMKEETCDLDFATVLKDEVKSEINIKVIQPQSDVRIIPVRKYLGAVAAIFVMGFGALTIMKMYTSSTGQIKEYTYKGKYVMLDDPSEAEEAIAITKDALAYLSNRMNKSSKKVLTSVSAAQKADIFK